MTLSKRSSTVSVVVPARNEARNVAFVFDNLPVGVDEVILVDGNSVDDTIAVAQRARPDVRVVRQARRGKGNALAAGFHAATGDYIVMIDADGSMHPAEIRGSCLRWTKVRNMRRALDSPPAGAVMTSAGFAIWATSS